MRNFRAELANVPCWDEETDRLFQMHGVPLRDCVLQNREELIGFCEWIEAHSIRSYLEVGVWTGRLVTLLHQLFRFERVAACDTLVALEYGLPIQLHREIVLFKGSSHSLEYRLWRESQAPFDLVMIDGDHSYAGVERDYRIHRQLGDRYLAFHDIRGSGAGAGDVARVWTGIGEPYRHEIAVAGRARAMGIGITAL